MSGTKDGIPEYKLILLGDGGVGKTSLVKRHETGEFNESYDATMGFNITPLMFHTNRGPIIFNVWDTSGQEKVGGLRANYYTEGQCAIMMFDVTSRVTFNNVPSWHEDITERRQNIPIALVGNKIEARERKVKKGEVTFHRNVNDMRYFEMSVKINHNLNEPFLWLAREVIQDNDLHFVDPTAPFDEDFDDDDHDDESDSSAKASAKRGHNKLQQRKCQAKKKAKVNTPAAKPASKKQPIGHQKAAKVMEAKLKPAVQPAPPAPPPASGSTSDSSDVLMTFLDSEKGCLRCAPSKFFDWLTGEDIATMADLLEAISDDDYKGELIENGLKKFKFRYFEKAVTRELEKVGN